MREATHVWIQGICVKSLYLPPQFCCKPKNSQEKENAERHNGCLRRPYK